jgi:predicted aldo/keto reductase-like oxidoreductase
MQTNDITRRQFLGTSAVFTGAAILASMNPLAAQTAKRTAADQVELGKTGLKCSRLGLGAGTNSGNVQRSLGHEGFNKLIRYAYDQGITYFDTAQGYQTHEWIAEAVKGLPREKLFIQTKMPGGAENPAELLDRYRKELNTDYIDSVLIHCMTDHGWHDQQKRVMDALEEAKDKKIIRAKGVSCHGLPALTRATETGWVDIHLVRVNPQGRHIDGHSSNWNESGNETTLPEVLKELKAMHEKGRGIIGMKLIGNGEFTKAEDREKSIRYAMGLGLLDAVVIGFKSPAEIDEAIERINRALAS